MENNKSEEQVQDGGKIWLFVKETWASQWASRGTRDSNAMQKQQANTLLIELADTES